MIGVLGYYLLIAAVYTLMSHSGVFIRYRKYILGILLFAGFGCVSLFFFNEHEFSIALVAIFLSLIGLLPFFQRLSGKDTPTEVIDIPGDSYNIVSIEDLNQGNLSLKYILRYRDQEYYLTTVPPAGKPPVKLIVHIRPNEEIHFADLIETGRNLSIIGFIDIAVKLIGFAAAVILPIALKTADSSAAYSVFSTLLTIMVGAAVSSVTSNSKGLLGKLICWGGRILLLIGLIEVILHIPVLFR